MSTEKGNTKKPYEKPVLRIIELSAEEIMGVCKVTPTSPGPRRITCSLCRNQYTGS